METPIIEIAIGRQFPKKVIPLIDEAKKSIYIIVYEWRWYPDQISDQIQIFNNSIVRAKQRGLDIKAVIWDKKISNILNQLGIRNKWIHQSKLLHAKLMIIDKKIVIIGSHNYTKTAFDFNFENSVILYDEKTALEFTKFFETFFY